MNAIATAIPDADVNVSLLVAININRIMDLFLSFLGLHSFPFKIFPYTNLVYKGNTNELST